MTLGIKVGLQPQSLNDIEMTQTPFAEVWFNILRKDEYDGLFTIMKKRNMQVGLHYWGHTKNNLWTNICYYNDLEIIRESMAQMMDTITLAATHTFQYVNIHPSNYALFEINFQHATFTQKSQPLDPIKCEQTFFENLHLLNTYAEKLGVIFTIETIPPFDYANETDRHQRKHPMDLYAPDNNLLVKAATEGFMIANDFGHTTCSVRTNNRADIWKYLLDMTKKLAPQTKLLHLGYIIPPYNGSDYHDHLDTPQFESDLAVPNKNELLILLNEFTHRNDIFALAEPDGRHAENYFYLKTLLKM